MLCEIRRPENGRLSLVKYTYLCVKCDVCGSFWPLYYADGERTEMEMKALWKNLNSSPLLKSSCPANHEGGFVFPEDFSLSCREDHPSRYPSAGKLGPSTTAETSVS